MKKKTIRELEEENAKVLVNGGPRLSWRYQVWIIARDRMNKRVLIGGLGSMGIGEMWFNEESRHRAYIGYDEAPDANSDL